MENLPEMQSEGVSLNLDKAGLRAAFNEDLKDSLPQMALAFGILFVLFTISHFVLLRKVNIATLMDNSLVS